MGVDLKLLPLDGDCDTITYSHVVLPLDRCYPLWVKIKTLPSEPIPDNTTTYVGRVPDGSAEGEYGYGVTVETPYGNRIQLVRAKDLLKLADHFGVAQSWKNSAAWAYLAAAPPKLRVGLYWH